MIPVVYDKNDTERNSNGLGRLTDCIECTVEDSKEDFSCELHITYPINGQHVDLLSFENIIGVQTKPFGNIQLFDIYNIQESDDWTIEVDAHHVRHRLHYYPTTWVYGKTMPDIIRSLNMVHVGAKLTDFGEDVMAIDSGTNNFGYHLPFMFWTNINQDSIFYQIYFVQETAYGCRESGNNYALITSTDIATNYWDVLFGTDGLIKVFGLSVEFDNFDVYISEPDALSSDRSDEIILRYGKNISEFTRTTNISDYEIYTHAIPYYIRNQSNADTKVAQFFFDDPTASNSFPLVVEIPNRPIEVGYDRYVCVDVTGTQVVGEGKYSFVVIGNRNTSLIKTLDVVEAATIAKANKINSDKLSPTFDIRMQELRESSIYETYRSLETLILGDVITVAIEPINTQVNEQVRKVSYNVLAERYDEITIGAVADSLATILVALAESADGSSSQSNTHIDYSTELTQYTTEQNLSEYDDGELTWKLSYTYTSGGSNYTVTSEPVRPIGNLITLNLLLYPVKDSDDVTLSIGVWRKILAGLPIPKKGDVWFSFPSYRYATVTSATTGNETQVLDNYEVDYHIDENGDLYMRPKNKFVISNSNAASQYRGFHLHAQYISAEGSYSDAWNNYITTTSVDWKERDSE